jgi:hypothetical protein
LQKKFLFSYVTQKPADILIRRQVERKAAPRFPDHDWIRLWETDSFKVWGTESGNLFTLRRNMEGGCGYDNTA